MAAIQKVVLLKSLDIYRARPAYLVAEPGDTIRFLNFTDRSIVLGLPGGVFTSGDTVAAGDHFDATVLDNAVAGRHGYTGSVVGLTDTTVQGESSPEIIIDRFGLPSPARRPY